MIHTVTKHALMIITAGKRKLLVFFSLLLSFGLVFSCTMTSPTIVPIDFSLVSDGTYQGMYESTLVSAETEVVMVKGRMIDLTLLRHDNGLGKKAEKIIDTILKEQSIAVDVVSGATYSSKAILKATEHALRKGIH